MPQIDVKDSTGATLAIITPAADGVRNAEISRELNGDHVLSFQLPATSGKLQYLTNDNYIYCDSMEFVLLDEDSVQIERREGYLWAKIQARESWCLLDRQHITICNDTLIEGYSPLEVIITTTGSTAGGYAAGSAGSALSHILSGSGWTVGTVDVTGTYEVRTTQESILQNINKCQELWGGWLVFDSAAYTVSLRKESTWQPYSGYEIRLGKNLKGVTRSYDYDIVTKFWAFGQNDAHFQYDNIVQSGTAQAGGANTITLQVTAYAIADAYTDGWIVLTGGTGSGQERRIIDYTAARIATVLAWDTPPDATTTYTIYAKFLLDFTNLSTVRSYIWRNQDIIDPAELLTKAGEVLDEMKVARVRYVVDHVDSRTLSAHSHETFAVGHMVDIIDAEMGIAVQVRVTKHAYQVFQNWICSLALGDVSYELKKILADFRKNTRVTYQQGRSSSSTLVIAHQITSKLTRRADFIVPNGDTSIQTWIAKAIDLLPLAGGKIMLLEGEYLRDGNIVLPSNVTLAGQGLGSVIKTKDNLDIENYAITNSDYTGGNSNIVISDIYLDGNRANQSAGAQYGMYFRNITNSQVRNCWITSFRWYGIYYALSVDTMTQGNIIGDNVFYGLMLIETDKNTVSANTFLNNGSAMFLLYADDSTVNGNVCRETGCICLQLSYNNTVIGNVIYGSNGHGLEMVDANNNIANNNTVQVSKYCGLYIADSDNNTISGNILNDNSQYADNTYDNIFVDDDSNYNNIQGNTCRRGALANKPRYGVRINSADCDGNLVTNNDLYDSGTSGSLSDFGSATVTTAGNRL